MAKRKNPFGEGDEQPKRALTAQQWCDLGNDKLAGRVPYTDGKGQRASDLPPVKWLVRNGVPTIVFA